AYSRNVCASNEQQFGGKSPAIENPVHYHTFWERTRIKRIGYSTFPRANRERWASYGNASANHALFHDHSLSLPIGDRSGMHGARRRDICIRHGKISENR